MFHSNQGGAGLPSSVSGGAAVKANGEALTYEKDYFFVAIKHLLFQTKGSLSKSLM